MPWACTSLHGVLGGLLSRGAYIPGGLITEKKKRFETSHSGAGSKYVLHVPISNKISKHPLRLNPFK